MISRIDGRMPSTIWEDGNGRTRTSGIQLLPGGGLIDQAGYGSGYQQIAGSRPGNRWAVPLRPDAEFFVTSGYEAPDSSIPSYGIPRRTGNEATTGYWMPRAVASLTSQRGTGGNYNGVGGLLNSLFASIDSGNRGAIDDAAVGAKSAADTAYGAMIRNLSRMGVNPQAPRFAATMKDWAANRAAMEAAARNQASRQGQQSAFANRMSLFRAMSDLEEAERNRQFQASQGRESRSWQSGEAAASRSWQDQGANRSRGWQVEDRNETARAQRAEAEENARILDAYANSQRTQPAAPSPSARPAAPGLVVPAHTPANFPATEPREPLQLNGSLGGDFSGGTTPSLSGYMGEGKGYRPRQNRNAYNLRLLKSQL